jgi:putative endonuclease
MSKELGDIAEIKAASYLESIGYTIVDTNYYTRFGEIDIICTQNSILYFVEVKSGANFEPIYNITKQKIEKLTKSINIYLKDNKINKMKYQLNAVIIKNDDIELIENITIN